jgi:hypothetical protein
VKYLVSFPSAEMEVPPEGLQVVSDDSRAVVAEAKAAGVWVFGGGLDDSVAPVLVAGDGTLTEGGYPQTSGLDGGWAVLEVPTREEAVAWAARLAAACRCRQELRVFHHDPDS